MTDTINLEQLENTYPTMDAVQMRMASLFGQRDNTQRPDFSLRSNLFSVGLGDLSTVVFIKDGGLESKEAGIARVYARVFSIAHWAGGVSVSESMSTKFPVEGCGYCGNKPCSCLVDRDRGIAPAELPAADTKSWSIRYWQQHLAELYDENNSKNLGPERVFFRLFGEYNELIDYVERNNGDGHRASRDPGFRNELADLSAWTLSFSTMIGVDAQSAVLKRFGNGCTVCGKKNACSCGMHNIKPADLADSVITGRF